MVVMTRGRIQKDRGNSPMTVHASRQAEQDIEEVDQLLPGIPNEITIDQIAPKLPWTAFHVLSSVNRGWQRAIQSHQIYEARVRSKSTQSLVALSDLDPEDQRVHAIALFSIEDSSCCHLPPIPGLKRGIPLASEWIWLHGKLYVLGGLQDCSLVLDPVAECAEVYMWDLAGQRQWKQCASMAKARVSFGCAVKDGKIYVFAGRSFKPKVVCGSEVYDPEEDAWSPFTPVPMASLRSYHRAFVVGEELFLFGHPLGKFDHKARSLAKEFYDIDDKLSQGLLIETAGLSAEVYHPLEDRWRIVKEFKTFWPDILLMVGGNLCRILQRMDPLGIEVYNIVANSWDSFQPFSFDVSEWSHFHILKVHAAVSVDDEILAIAEWTTFDEEDDEDEEDEEGPTGTYLIRSRGVGGKDADIVWQRLTCSVILDDYRPVMCPIQL